MSRAGGLFPEALARWGSAAYLRAELADAECQVLGNTARGREFCYFRVEGDAVNDPLDSLPKLKMGASEWVRPPVGIVYMRVRE